MNEIIIISFTSFTQYGSASRKNAWGEVHKYIHYWNRSSLLNVVAVRGKYSNGLVLRQQISVPNLWWQSREIQSLHHERDLLTGLLHVILVWKTLHKRFWEGMRQTCLNHRAWTFLILTSSCFSVLLSQALEDGRLPTAVETRNSFRPLVPPVLDLSAVPKIHDYGWRWGDKCI